MNAAVRNILIVEDELLVALNLKKELESQGYNVCDMATSEDEAVTKSGKYQPDIILMDINLEDGGSGISAAQRIKQHSDMPIVFVTAYSSDKIIKLAGDANPYGYVLKPYQTREVIAVIETALTRHAYEQQTKDSEARLSLAMDAAKMSVIEFNSPDQRLDFYGHDQSITSLGFANKMGKTEFLDRVSVEDAQLIENALEKGLAVSRRMRLKRDKLSGKNGFMDVFFSNIKSHGDTVTIGAVKNVTEEQKILNEVALSSTVIEHMRESLVVLDDGHNIKTVNPAFATLIDYEEKDLIGKNLNDFILHERRSDENFFKDLETRPSQQSIEVVLVNKLGKHINVLLNTSTLTEEFTGAQTVVCITDVTKLMESERRLKRMAYSDPLTGFGNRAYFKKVLDELDHENGSNTVALLFLDLDSFKTINDNYGHDVGDQVLKTLSNRLHSVLRDEDHLIRLGGDEFLLVVVGQYDRKTLSILADKILEQTKVPIKLEDHSIHISCSVGVAYAGEKNLDRNQLLRNADSAMYDAKRAGKNGYSFFDEAQNGNTKFRLFIEQGLKQAIDTEDTMVWLQPIVDNSGNITGAEALCRWYDKEAGFIPPEEFIKVAEASWLINPLGLKVFRESFLAQKMLQDAGFTDIQVNINVSGSQLSNAKLPAILSNLLSEHSVKATQFTLEITESILLQTNSDKMIETLRDMGFQFALDDFGTGYSSLSRLTDYAVETVKIDRAFISDLLKDPKRSIVTKAIIQLSNELGHKVVAEGVEQIEQAEQLRQLGCEYMQGYLFGKAMPFFEFVKLMTKNKNNSVH